MKKRFYTLLLLLLFAVPAGLSALNRFPPNKTGSPKYVGVVFSKQADAFASRRGGARFRLAATYFEKAKVGKASWGTTPHAFLVGCPNPSGGRKEKFAQPKSGKLALVVVRRCFGGVHDSVVVE